MTLTSISTRSVALLLFVGAAGACGRNAASDSGATASPAPSNSATATVTATATPTIVDADGDGLDDAFELEAAKTYMPFLAQAATDACPLGGMLVRVRPHPDNPALLHVLYDHLYQNDCGLFGHVGDDEVFAVTVDPARDGAAGILAIKAISHQGTPCERDTTCGSLPGLTPCTTTPLNGAAWPVVFFSKDKHGSYADKNVCDTQSCFDDCQLPATGAAVDVVNAGEPASPLTTDLTNSGFITAANGWTESSLMHFDPWTPGKFGGAGDVSADLVDPAFLTPAN